MKEISRRNFIKGAAASALSVAALGKLGGFTTQAAAEEAPAAVDQYAPNELIPTHTSTPSARISAPTPRSSRPSSPR